MKGVGVGGGGEGGGVGGMGGMEERQVSKRERVAGWGPCKCEHAASNYKLQTADGSPQQPRKTSASLLLHAFKRFSAELLS